VSKSREITIAASAAVYVGAIALANYLIVHGFPGATATPFGTYTVPVGFGLVAPAGTYMIAVSWPARDILQRSGGRLIGIVAIFVGAAVSWWVSNPAIAVASGGTLLISETCDFLVYTPLQKRWFVPAVVASGIVAAVVDSVIFINWAGLPTSQIPGLIVGKLWIVTLVAGPIAWGLRKKIPTPA
jgi:uncharacterized PurR-regulated membrane protein YhhQ (DUF165 family)